MSEEVMYKLEQQRKEINISYANLPTPLDVQ
jgi:hypothetical protein